MPKKIISTSRKGLKLVIDNEKRVVSAIYKSELYSLAEIYMTPYIHEVYHEYVSKLIKQYDAGLNED